MVIIQISQKKIVFYCSRKFEITNNSTILENSDKKIQISINAWKTEILNGSIRWKKMQLNSVA